MDELFTACGALDATPCETARLDRDARFDGRFFICVRTTKIYCRPVCRVKLALPRNVHFVTSAAAAEQLGYRPCLRCRPESAPGSAAWNGTASVVRRGMSIIAGGYLDRHSCAELATRLGMSVRHMNRLFREHAGASPRQMATTRRVQAAKRLITDTALPLSEIAFEAGFQSARRFNEAMRDTYGRTPSKLRTG